MVYLRFALKMNELMRLRQAARRAGVDFEEFVVNILLEKIEKDPPVISEDGAIQLMFPFSDLGE